MTVKANRNRLGGSLLSLVLLLCCAMFGEVSLASNLQRIVSTSGNASQMLVRLGLNDKLVAVDTTSLLPPDLMAKKPKIGYRRQLSAEGILSMRPDLVILAPDAGPPGVVKQLQNTGIQLFYLQDKQTLAGINEDILRLGEALGVSERAQRLIAEQQAQASALQAIKASYQRPPKLLMLMDTGSGKLFAFGRDSVGGHMIAVLGGEVSAAVDGMKPISKEALVADQADAVIVARRSDHAEVIKPLAKGLYVALDKHGAAARRCLFDANIMQTLGFGPDTADVAGKIAKRIRTCIDH